MSVVSYGYEVGMQARRKTSGSSGLNGTCVAANGDAMVLTLSAEIDYKRATAQIARRSEQLTDKTEIH